MKGEKAKIAEAMRLLAKRPRKPLSEQNRPKGWAKRFAALGVKARQKKGKS